MTLDEQTDERLDRRPTFQRPDDTDSREDLLIVLAGVAITAGVLYDVFQR
jgi:hypothetical protein